MSYTYKATDISSDKIETIISFDLSSIKPGLDLSVCSLRSLEIAENFEDYSNEISSVIKVHLKMQNKFNPNYSVDNKNCSA